MREIKFRAWHKNRKKYYKVMHLHIETSLNGGVWATCEGFNIIKQDNVKIQVQPGDCIIEQFTGLKDINGVEIYEGDIVSDNVGTGFIEYIEKYAAFRVNYQDGQCKWFYHYLDSEYKTIEIIGNIHQNKDLLK